MPNGDPVSVANIDPHFEARLLDMQEHALNMRDAIKSGSQLQWYRPRNRTGAPGWSGDVLAIDSFHTPFNRDKANGDYLAAIEDGDNPGTTGDVVASTLQIDYLAMLERGLRNRHTMRRPRAAAHAAARFAGAGRTIGIYGVILEYVRDVLRLAKEPPA